MIQKYDLKTYGMLYNYENDFILKLCAEIKRLLVADKTGKAISKNLRLMKNYSLSVDPSSSVLFEAG